ncbi:MAG: SAM-dependent methyltransferase [Candidatus Woesebacteria bacterium GW2011_GWA1_39_21]|uniref:SAM-dependent methyltransferase n=1 Tax=Candidatus Woesebacteria bacterium GW2011_GWA1_39_21 TaxID=1618550 RepID=A0A0G0QJS3_9BACT|nr:MAG: SAM-dependent methyltransferase [Candidatus Woesebacteria bacterium GW2011_GWA1_39_21]
METEDYYQKGMYLKKASKERDLFYNYIVNTVCGDLVGGHKNILDAGCGDGSLSKKIKDETGAKVYGCDISKKGLELARKKGILTKVCDLDKRFPYRANSFDLLFSNQVIEHVLSPDHYLSECYRVLKNGGKLILTTPNLVAWYNRVLFLFGIYPIFLEASMRDKRVGTKFMKKFAATKQGVGHIRVLTAEVLKDLLKLNNFKIIRITSLKRNLFGDLPKQMRMVYKFIDGIFSKSTELGSDTLVVAKKAK